MSGFQNPSNAGRVTRAIELLGHIEKSAKSNKASNEEVHAMLVPLLAKLGEFGIVTLPPGHVVDRGEAEVQGVAESYTSPPMTPERMALSQHASKCDRAVRAAEKILEELRAHSNAAQKYYEASK